MVIPQLVVTPPLTRGTDTIVQDPIVDIIVAFNVVNNDISLKRSQWIHWPRILDNYIIYLQEQEFNVVMSFDLTSFKQAIDSPQSSC